MAAATRKVAFCGKLSGTISTRMSAVIKTDSMFVTAWKSFAKTELATRLVATTKVVLSKISKGVKGTNFMKLRQNAAATKTIK